MSTIRPVKKKKEEQDYTLTNSGGLTFEEYQSMKNSGDEEKTQNQQNQYTTWRDQSKELLNEYQNYASSGDYQTQEAHDDYFSRLQKQLGKAVSMRKKYGGENLEEIENLVQDMSDAVDGNFRGRNYYSQWEDKLEYEDYRKAMQEQEKSQKEIEDRKKAAESYLAGIQKQYQEEQSEREKPVEEENPMTARMQQEWEAEQNTLNPGTDVSGKKPGNVHQGSLGATKGAYAEAEAERQRKAQEKEEKQKAYEALRGNADFQEKSQYASTKIDKSQLSVLDKLKLKSDYGDEAYEYINDVDGMRSEIARGKAAYGLEANNTTSTYEKKGYDYLTDDEKQLYNYIHATEGKEPAEEYLDSLELTKRRTEYYQERERQNAVEHPVRTSLASLVLGPDKWKGFAEDALNGITGKEVDPYSEAHLSANMQSAERSGVSEQLSPVGSFLYNAGMSMADNLVIRAITLGGGTGLGEAVSLAIMGGGAATDAVIAAKERGVDDSRAVATGAAAGIAEVLFEKISFEQLNTFAQKSPESMKELIVNVLKGSFTEGSEEFFTSVANFITDGMINGGLSEWNTKIKEYMEAGYTAEEAEKLAGKDTARDIGLDFLGGALSGGIMSGFASSLNLHSNSDMEATGAAETGATQEETVQNPGESVQEQIDNARNQEETAQAQGENVPQLTQAEYEQLMAEQAAREEEAQNWESEAPTAAGADQTGIASYAGKMIDTVLEHGSVSEQVAETIVATPELKTELERRTGVPVQGNEQEQRNAVREIVQSYAAMNQEAYSGEQTRQESNVKAGEAPERANAAVNGSRVEITGVTAEKGQELALTGSDGAKYDVNNVQFLNEETQELYQRAVLAGDGDNAEVSNSFIRNYHPAAGISVELYARAYDSFYKTGKNGIALSSALKAGENMVELAGEDSMRDAWGYGRAAWQQEVEQERIAKKTAERKGEGTFRDETEGTEEPVRELQRLVAEKTGIDITRTSELEHDANGQFTASMMQMVISANASNEYTTMIHELGEFGLAYDRAGMKAVQDTLVQWWAEKNGMEGLDSLNEIISEYQRRYEKAEGSKTRSQAVDEMVNDALGGLFSTEKGVEEFVDWLQQDSGMEPKKQRTILQSITDMLKDLIDAMKQMVKGSKLSKAARTTLQMEEQRAQEIRQRFLDVLDRATVKAESTGEYIAEENQVRYELKGVDEDGVEVYETSDDVKGMSLKDRKARLLDIMINQYKGRTAKFTQNGETYYAQYDNAGIRKGVFGDKKSDKGGLRAKVNIGADGNYIELAENARYTGTSEESGKSNKFHRNAQTWDYYIKTIRSDGKNYDVLINVKNTKDNHYVYDITLHEKSTEPSMRQLNPHLRSRADASTGNIASQSGNVNTINEAGTEALLKSYDERREHFGLRMTPAAELRNSPLNSVAVDYTGISAESAEHFNDVIQKLSEEYYTGLTKIEVADKKKAFGAQSFATTDHNNSVGQKNLVLNPHKMNDYEGMVSRVKELSRKGYCVDLKAGTEGDYVATHEFAHSLIDMESPLKNWVNLDEKQFKRIRNEIRNLYDEYVQEVKGLEAQRQELKDNEALWSADADAETQWKAFQEDAALQKKIKEVKISGYSMRSADEFMAEAFTEYRLGKNPGTYAEKVTEVLNKYFGKNKEDSALLTSAQRQKINETQNPSESNVSESPGKVKSSLPEYENLKQTNRSLVKENEKYKTLVEELQRQLGLERAGARISLESLNQITKEIYEEYRSSYDRKTFRDKLGAFFEDVSSGKTESRGNFLYLAEELMRPVLQDTKSNLELTDYAKDILKEIKSVKITLDDTQKAEVAYTYGGYNEFRKANFGKITLGNEGVPLDSIWQQWAGKYPEVFDSEMNSVDQPAALAEIVATLREDYANDYGWNLNDAVSMAAAELLEKYESLPEVRRLNSGQTNPDLRVKYREMIREIKKESAEKYKEQLRSVREESKAKIQDLSTQLERQKAKFRSYASETRAQRIESENRQRYRNRIEKNTNTLIDWLNKNSDKQHIPEGLKRPTMEFITSLDFLSSNAQPDSHATRELQMRMNNLYRSLNELESGDGDFMTSVDPDLLPSMNQFLDETKGENIPEMNSRKLEELDRIMRSLKAAITTANKMYQNQMYENVEKIGQATSQELREKKEKKYHSGAAGVVDRMMGTEMLTPYAYFRKLGPAAETVYQEMRAGLNKRTELLNQAQNYGEEMMEGVKADKWTGDRAEIHKFKIGGEKVELTIGQVMNLYLLAKRPQALQHLVSKNGGFNIAEKSLAKGQKRSSETIKISAAELARIINTLTEEQRSVADKMQKFLAENCAEWGNEVSMKMYGYKKFGEKYYWPIKTNDNYTRTSDQNADGGKGLNSSLYAIRNQGMTKNVIKNASNPLSVGDVFDVYTDHVVNMANYNAWVIPLNDATKWYNYKSVDDKGNVMGTVKAEIERAYGKQAKEYFINLIKDANGEVGKGYGSEISDTLSGKYKAAAVGANLRVVVQQPTAYFRAAAVVDPKYLAMAAGKPEVAEMQKYSPIAKWKSWGYWETGIGRSMKQLLTGQQTSLEKAVELSMAPAGMADDLTWGILWKAVKMEVKDQNPGMDVKSDAFMKKVSDRFDDVVDQTQVVDSFLHRSQMMRSTNGAVKMATAFMAEPTKSFNLMRTAITEMTEAQKKYGNNSEQYKKARNMTFRAAGALAVTGIITALAASPIDAWRDNDEDKTWGEKFMEQFWANVGDNLNPLGQIPYVKDVVSMIQGSDPDRMDIAGISTLIDAVQQAVKYAQGDGNKTLYGVVKGLVRGFSQVSGIPAYNALRTVETTYNALAKEPLDTSALTKKKALFRLDRAAKENDEKLVQKYIQYLSDEYVKKRDAELEAGEKREDAEKKAKLSIMSAATGYFKPLYQAGDTAEKIRIKNLLYKISVDGKQLYKDYNWKKWEEE